MESDPIWVDVGVAKDKISRLDNTLLHAGPPLNWEKSCGPMKGAILGGDYIRRMGKR
jgi:hypothetical protein